MKFALLGIDDATLALAAAVCGNAENSLEILCEIDDSPFTAERAALLQFALGTKRLAGWEALLDDRAADVVLVARSGDQDRRGEQLRRLVQAGRPLIVSHPLCDSMLCYEIDMARSENNCPLLAYLPERWHPATAELAAWISGDSTPEASPLGVPEQWIFERPLSDRSKASVIAQFARDVDWIRALAGDVTRLAAFGPADAQAAYATLQVQMTATLAPTIRWSIVSVDEHACARLTVVGSRGKAVLNMAPHGEAWSLMRGGDSPATVSYPPWQPAHLAIERLKLAVEGKRALPPWLDAIRSIELAETIDRSLRRGRAVDVKIDEASEESNFKGTMAALGCGLLLAGVFVLFLVGMAHSLKGLVEWPAQLLDQWPKLLLGLLGLFLGLQFLLQLTRRRGGPGSPPGS